MYSCHIFELHRSVLAAMVAQKRDIEELPLAQGEGWRLRAPGCNGAGVAERSYPTSEVGGGGAAERSNPTSKEPQLRGAGGPRGATPRLRSGGAAVRRYPMSKVRETQVRW